MSLILSVAPKKEWSVNAKDRHVWRDFLVLQNVRVAFLEIFVGYLRNRRCFGHFVNVNEGGENHARLDGHRKIGKHGEQERDQPGANFQGR